jgi:uncharacterized protein YbjT (DUF2867 family)
MNFPNAQSNENPVLVTGATGYIGGRLVPRLLELGIRVRCLARDGSRLQKIVAGQHRTGRGRCAAPGVARRRHARGRRRLLPRA